MRVVQSTPVETLYDLSRYNKSVMSQFPPLVGETVRVTRQGSWRGVDHFQCVATGVLEELTLSLVVIRRTDLAAHLSYPQYITYTFADFLTGLYKCEKIK